MAFGFGVYYFHMGFGMMGGMMGPGFFFPVFFFVPMVMGIIGSLIGDRVAGGVLLILAALFSLPLFFGFFGISFVLLLVGGILALSRK
ncbi:hypothetical protein GWK48_10230 [Metallosphaera tengchongensis]|uniref:Uncharacterized protein n=2 Tax=Metallosphaera tengchongensis TaxID=1532350 RepID=A0A6N0NW27_9CREN|nr:hypothetical protein GWK48_10230 [Metallosphaera tengchongensis]